MNSKLIVFFAIVAAVFAEEMKMEKEVDKMEDIKMPEPEKYPPGVDEKLCPDYPNCDNVLLHTPTVDVIKSIKIKGALPYETLMPAAYPYAYGAGAFYAPNIVAPTIAARTIAAPYITYPGLTSRVLVNGLW